MFEVAARDGWRRVAFGDVVRQVRDRVTPEESGLERYVAGEHMDTDDLRIRRWGAIGDGYLGPAFHMRFRPGHVLYGSRRTYLRKVAVADFEGVTANTTFVLEPKDPKVLSPALLPFIMQAESFHEHSIKQSKGSVNPYVNFSDLTWYEFELPPPEEQRPIVEILQTADGAIEKLEELKVAARVVECSLFEAALASCHADPVPLGCLLLAPPRNGCSAQEASTSTGHWVLALSAITKQGYRRGELKAVQKTRVMEAALLRQGDLLISRSNTRE
jgi:type I restriction enzyme S subunit